LGGLIGGLYRTITERYIATEAATLQQKVETQTLVGRPSGSGGAGS